VMVSEKDTLNPICEKCIVAHGFGVATGRLQEYFDYGYEVVDGEARVCDAEPSNGPNKKCRLARESLRRLIKDDFLYCDSRSQAREWLDLVDDAVKKRLGAYGRLSEFVTDYYKEPNYCESSFFLGDPEDLTFEACPSLRYCIGEYGTHFNSAICRPILERIAKESKDDVEVQDAMTRLSWIEFKQKYEKKT